MTEPADKGQGPSERLRQTGEVVDLKERLTAPETMDAFLEEAADSAVIAGVRRQTFAALADRYWRAAAIRKARGEELL